jgi:uncharacterized protein with NRDE domain
VCTLAVAWQVFEQPIAVAANRDERDGRPSEPPARRDWAQPVVAPRDKTAGGTWIGYNDDSVLAAITNRWLADAIDADRSRGVLVRAALAESSATAAVDSVKSHLQEATYDGFNLVVADDTDAQLLSWDGSLRITRLEPGVHVVVNVGADGRYQIPPHREAAGEQQARAAEELHQLLQRQPGESADGWLARAGDALGDHESGVCIHGDGFGTKSSSLIALGPDSAHYEFADGPPCEAPYRVVEGQL